MPGSPALRLQAGKLALLAVGYFAAGKLGLALTMQNDHIALLWLSAGISVAALLRWGMWCWPGVFAGALGIQLSMGYPLPLAGATAVGCTLGPLAAAWLLKRGKFDFAFSRLRDLMLFIGSAAAGMMLSATFGAGLLWLGGLLPAAGLPQAWLHWWLGDTMGVLLAGPLLLSVSHASCRETASRIEEALLCGLLLLATTWLSFFSVYEGRSLPLAFLPLPLLLWAALRLGITGTALATLALALLSTAGTAQDRGAFGSIPGDESMYIAWLYMFTALLTGLMVSTILNERNRTALALQRTNELLALAQREAKAGVWDWELPSGKITWSDELFTLFELDPKTVEPGFHIWRNRIHPDDRLAADERIAESVRTGTPLFSEYRIVLPNGIAKWILAVGNCIQDEHGETVRMAGLCIDVTVQKEAQRRARHSEMRYQALIQQAADALYVHDLDGRIVEVNQRACEALGYSREELLKMNLGEIVPGLKLDESQPFWNRIEPGKPTAITSTHKRRDGSTFPVEVKFAVLELDGEKLVMALASDISTRVQAEEKLLDTLHQLEEKELAKTRFLAAAGHDLRQPVAAASLFVDTLKLTSPTPQQSELIEKLKQSMDNFAGLLEHLLDISRFDSGLVKPQIATFKLPELFDWLERSFSEPAEKKGLRLRFAYPKNRALIVRTDAGLLHSVLMNLVSNALKFTARGGILVSARQRGNKVLLQVWDTGIGIPGVYLPHIFDEFYQVSNPQRSREGGLGLGLSICKRAMTLLGGEVTCHSRPGCGSVFELTLPLEVERRAVKRTTPEKPVNATDQSWAEGKRIVVLEDDLQVAAGMVSLLQSLGAEAQHFPSAEEALNHRDIAEADYYIVDYSLRGGMTGYQFLEKLQHRRHKLMRAVILTGETSSQFVRSVEDSPWPVLHKPANLARIAASLNISH